MTDLEKVNAILKHIQRVEQNCIELAMKILPTDLRFALDLISRGRSHDLSKFKPYQFEHLWDGDTKFESALLQHRSLEMHHPDYHTGGIYGMSDLDIAEMVCDCLARAQEFGSDIRDFFFREENAPTLFDYKGDIEIQSKIEKYLSLILAKTFSYATEKA